MSIHSINPATGEVLETLEPTSPPDIERALAGAHAAFLEWRTRPFAERAVLMHAAAQQLRADKSGYAATMTREMGKPIVQAEAEVEKCAVTCDYYADHAEVFLAEQPRERPALGALRRDVGEGVEADVVVAAAESVKAVEAADRGVTLHDADALIVVGQANAGGKAAHAGADDESVVHE